MCTGCLGLTGFDLDAYVAALEHSDPQVRRRFLEAVEAAGHPGLAKRLEAILSRHGPT